MNCNRLIFIAIFLFLLPSPALPANAEPDEPEAVWSLGELSGGRIPGINQKVNECYPNCVTSVQVKGGRALKFDGIDDYIDFGANPGLDFQGKDFSIELAFNPRDLKEGSTIISIGGVHGFLIQVGRNYGDKVIMFLNNWNTYRYSKINAVKTGYWTHIVFVKKGESLDCYIDGRLSNGSASSFPASVDTLGNLYLGGAVGYGFFSGLIDQVKIYSRALSPEEIKIHNRKLPHATYTKYIIINAKRITKYVLIFAMIVLVIYMRLRWAREESRKAD